MRSQKSGDRDPPPDFKMVDHGNPKEDMVEKMDINRDTKVIVEERRYVTKETQNVQSANTVDLTVPGVHKKSKVTIRASDRITSGPKYVTLTQKEFLWELHLS
jgi:hypothetical protein